MNSRRSTTTATCPARRSGAAKDSFATLTQRNQACSRGSYTWTSLKQRVVCPEPPKRYRQSRMMDNVMPARACGAHPIGLRRLQTISLVSKTYKSLSRFVPSQPPKMYSLKSSTAEAWFARGGGCSPLVFTWYQEFDSRSSPWRSLRYARPSPPRKTRRFRPTRSAVCMLQGPGGSPAKHGCTHLRGVKFSKCMSPAARGPLPSQPPRIRICEAPQSSVAEWPFLPLGFTPWTCGCLHSICTISKT
mmetsp:Transcript_100709/g.325000  ORF Transcript_100709/g.325000 Transcript_100709/m.325000 type:complete len:246 (-) Transcript_100709:292-1029(-)